MLISHTHWDHIQGIPFFGPFFIPGQKWDLYAPQGFGESLRDTLAGQMEYTYFPITPEAFGADVRYTNLGEGRLEIDDFVIQTRYLNHPALTLGFRIEADGSEFVYACDHEPHSRELAGGCAQDGFGGEDRAHADFIKGVDLLIHDAQYLDAEYAAKAGWGHSTVEYALTIGRAAQVRTIALTHHDPNRTDEEIDAYLVRFRAEAAADDPEIVAAYEGMEIALARRPLDEPRPVAALSAESAIRHVEASERPVVLLITLDDAIAAKAFRATASEDILLIRVRSLSEALSTTVDAAPALILADHGLVNAESACTLRRAVAAEPALVWVGGEGPLEGGIDRLEEPWSPEYARTRIRTWLMRTERQWTRAPVPSNEAERLAALHALGMLDTSPEDRFDRMTRLAAGLFRMPISLISLVDRDRQWFKSCLGVDVCETSREDSFCAHAVAAQAMLVVPDTFLDPRFRDNPLVARPPHIRFYAGAPIRTRSGFTIGTLCILDIRPRELSEEQRALLVDLASLAEQEINRTSPDAAPAPVRVNEAV